MATVLFSYFLFENMVIELLVMKSVKLYGNGSFPQINSYNELKYNIHTAKIKTLFLH
jgi:hypothetical protein